MFSNSVKILSVDGFEIKVDPSWLIIASLVTWSLSQQYFPDVMPEATAHTYLIMALIGMLGLFASLLLHELAHSVVARRLGIEIKSITLFIFGGLAELGSEPNSARDEFWIAVAGPVMSLCLAACFWVFAQIAVLASGADPFVAVLSYLALINLVLALFNLVPAFPLDGGRILRAYLWHRGGNALKATQMAAQSGTVFSYFLMAMGVLALFQGAFVSGLWYLLIGGFVLIAARSTYTSKLAQTVLADKTVSDLMTLTPVTVAPEMTLSEFVNQIMLRHSVSFVPVVDGDVLLGHIDQTVLAGIDRENWGNARVGDVFVGLDTATMVAPDMAVPDLFEQISQTGRRKFMVVRDHQLLGVITLADLTRYLGLATLASPLTQASR
ncbi:site-2 protease family protein [uncultured Sulfitobacter sp.]|uniref:site-2 protease family protein n=1 Tax=uncultured Sulfitobacter sp. TaxID=191468 RepID=UPI00262ED9DD|nr:site-2 protease family protein [uncultured Sulfitobacter sp.]